MVGIFFIINIIFFILEIKNTFLIYLAISNLIVLFFLNDFFFSKNFINRPEESDKKFFLKKFFKFIKILFFLKEKIK